MIAILLVIGAAAVVSGGGGDDGKDGRPTVGRSINVAIVDNPQTQDLAHLTPSLFTGRSHIAVRSSP